MSTLIIFLSGIGFILSILSMYVLPIFINEVYNGIIAFLGLSMIFLALFLMKKEKRKASIIH